MIRISRFYILVLVVLPLAGYTMTLGDMADSVTKSFSQFGKMMIGLAYVSGIGFGISAVFKFKQHKDNPTQIPISTPFALLGVSCLLVFLPGIYTPAGATLFGDTELARGGGFDGSGTDIMPGSTYAYNSSF